MKLLKIIFKTKLRSTTIISLVMLIFTLVLVSSRNKDRNCLILHKMETSGSYKYGGSLYLILKEERGIIFDLRVSPSVYYQSKIGDYTIFRVPEGSIIKNWANPFIVCILIASLLSFLLCSLFVILEESQSE